jgi:hypothetical protein
VYVNHVISGGSRNSGPTAAIPPSGAPTSMPRPMASFAGSQLRSTKRYRGAGGGKP